MMPQSLARLAPFTVGLTLAAAGVAQFQFKPSAVLATGRIYDNYELVDLNGDGHLDMPTIGANASDQLMIFVNDGTGGMTLVETHDLADWGALLSVGDVDNDGILDLVTVTRSTEIELAVFFGHGSASFVPGPVLDLGTDYMYGMDIADFDSDGNLDVALANWDNTVSTNRVQVWLGDGAGNFGSRRDLLIGAVANDVEAVDVDGDGDLDVAATSYLGSPSFVHVFLNDGSANFGASIDYGVGRGTWHVHAGDLDCDGDPDLVAVNRNTDSVSVLRNRGDGTFDPHVEIGVGRYPIAGTLIDLDGDGDLDFAVPENLGYRVHILENDGQGNLSVAQVLSEGWSQITTEAGDLDGDGVTDLVVGTFFEVILVANATHQYWTDQGNALGTPALVGKGALTGGSAIELKLSDAAPSVPAALIASSSAISLPFCGGTMIPNVFTGVALGMVTNAQGGIDLPLTWPAGVPPQTEVFFQYWLFDGAAPAGCSASNAVRAATP